MDHQFVNLIDQGKFDEAKHFYQNNNIDIHHRDDFSFIVACDRGYLGIAQWLWNLSVELKSPINIHIEHDITTPFVFAIRSKNLELVKWLWNLSHEIKLPYDFSELKDKAFSASCRSGSLDIAQWLWDLSIKLNLSINIHDSRESNFLWACCYSLEFAKWLWKICNDINSPIDINIKNNNIFKNICISSINQDEDEILELIKWLWNISIELGKPFELDSLTFCYTMGNGRSKIAKWFWETAQNMNIKIDIHADDDRAFIWGCHQCNLEGVKWLHKISKKINSPINPLHIKKDNFFGNINAFSACMKNNWDKSKKIETAKWLTTICPYFKLYLNYNGEITSYEILEKLPNDYSEKKIVLYEKTDDIVI
jgi:hypothetical protein